TIKKALKGKMETLENWFGRNVLGVAASILIFVGLVYLGTLVYKHITETMKILSMYAISTLITGLGIALTVKKRNNFTDILTGCGCGSFFISILLTHIYFNRISDITAFSLLLLWMAAILYLSKALSSTLLSIVAHIGMIVSICFAFGMGITDEKLLLLLIYQAASITVILLGNIFCCKKTYYFGVFVSLFLTITASCFMWSRFTAGANQAGMFPFATTLPVMGIAAAFAAQFLGASFLSYLLSVSASRLKNESYRMVVHAANKALWLAALIINVYHIAYRIAAGMTADSFLAMTPNNQLTAVYAAVMISIAVILVHGALTLLLGLKLNFDSKLETYSVLFLSAAASVFLLILWSFKFNMVTVVPRITFLFVISLLLLLAKRISRNKTYAVGANVILAIDVLFMLLDGYRNMTKFGTIALSMGYMLLYIVIIWGQWMIQKEDDKTKYSTWVRLASFLLIETSLISIFLTSKLKYHTVILLLLLTSLNILLYLVRYDRNDGKGSALCRVMFVNELILLAFNAGFIAFAYKDSAATVLYMLLSVISFGFSFIRINEVIDGGDNNMAGILTGVKLTVLVLATVYGNTSWFDQAYCFSIVCMLTALTCIILGFAWRVKSLRLYGLVITLVCVLKLVTYDVTNLNTLMRVIALIGGGVICFIISAIYNYTSKKIYHE
ncbi:MAG: DUF2339 domain-containing protein, partial [Bacillota bacterium]|nr:DUF2339 domain-containing protein [Bacillota bacterium]